jgi:hypothetical protein
MTQLLRLNPLRWPYSLGQLRADEPSRSFSSSPSDAELAEYNVFPVQPTAQPSYDPTVQRVEEITPTQDGDTWCQQWQVVQLTPEEQAAYYRATHPPRWLEFGGVLQADAGINALLTAALAAAPALALGLSIGLGKAADGDDRVFLQSWQQAKALGLISTQLAQFVHDQAIAHDLPEAFVDAVAP